MPHPGRKIDWFATICLLGAMLSWALIPVFLRYLADYIEDGWTTNGARYPIGAALYLPFLILGIRRGQVTGKLLLIALIPTAINVAGQTAWAWCPYFVEPGLLSFLIRSTILWSVILSFIAFHDERALARSKRFWGGIGLAAIGLAGLLLRAGDGSTRTTVFGILLTLGCALAWSLYGIAMRITVRRTGVGLSFSIVGIYTALACVVMMFVWGDASQLVRIPLKAQIVLGVSAVLGVAIAHGLYYIAISRLGVAISQGTGMFAPFATYSLSYMLFDERLTGVQWASGIALLAGASLLVWAQQRLGHSGPA